MKKQEFFKTIGALFAFLPLANAQSNFVPFDQFMASTRSQPASLSMAQPASKVKDTMALETMRRHVLTMYRGVSVSHSYLLDGQHYDCVPVDQQPSVRILGLREVAGAPPLSMIKAKEQASALNFNSTTNGTPVTSQVDAARKYDAAGNAVGCEANSIPFRRITLSEMSRYSNLQEFFKKRPTGSVSSISGTTEGYVPPAVATHKYGITYQYVNNHGGNSNINLWRPYIYTSLGQIFSLSQQWYVGGSGASTQTAEVGWQNYPARHNGSQNSALFIYFTADNYNSTGCYDLNCAGFVQTNSSWHFGSGFSNYSVSGGAQYQFAVQFYLYNGNWWLALGGTWVGYYPGSVYRGGQLSRYAQIVEYGGETVGTTRWPGMGSGNWANTGFGRAAYHNNLYYINTSNGGVWETLTPLAPSPACYSVAGPYNSTGDWTRYFYFGGPGGTGCQ